MRADATAIVAAALAAVDPHRLVTHALAEPHLSLEHPASIHLLAVGKASPGMARACLERRVVQGGLAIGPDEMVDPGPLRPLHGSHPVPDENSLAAGRAALALTGSLEPADTLLVLLSGGASALMAVPAQGLTLEDKREVTERLLAANADIGAINCVRKHLSAIKGGRLAAASRARIVTLALSDVVDDDPAVIGSGPTVPDPTTFADARRVLERCGGLAAYPRTVVAHVEAGTRGAVPDTPNPGDAAFARATYHVVGSRLDAARAAAGAARAAGYDTVLLPDPVVGEARAAAARWVADLHARSAATRVPLCLVSSGETTVEVSGRGRGGRNQEFALALAASLPALKRAAIVVSVGTDGVDGPTDAAGARADSTTAARAARRGLDPMRYLEANDAWSFFDALGDLVRTGPTGTNVGDLQVALVGG